jgi:uncharacterized RDD family membrane protein YckC
VEITVQSDEQLKIDTPEQITLELPVAGIGSRFLAVAVDTVLQAVLLAVGFLALALGVARRFAPLRLVGPAAAILFVFCVYWGYFALFEIAWSGQTPGKRIVGIRVIHESGRPIAAYEAIGRNVLRVIDFLPAFYGVGLLVMMVNRYSRRIGDFVAGTLVVYDTPGRESGPDWYGTTEREMPSARLAHLSAEELALIETYLRRRVDLDALVLENMADQIVRRITQQTGAVQEPGQSADAFLELVARRARDGARFR